MAKKMNPKSQKARDAAKSARAILAMLEERYDEVIDRNGCSIYVPKDPVEAEAMMAQTWATMKLNGVDNFLYQEGDVVERKELDIGMTSLLIKNHQNANDHVKQLILPTATLTRVEKFFFENNFSSYEKFKKNLLPTYNGPDHACFIGTDIGDGIQIGYMFTLPDSITLEYSV